MSLEEHKQHTFDTYCKKIVKNEAANIQQEYQRQAEMEVTFSALTEQERNQLQYIDQYAPDRRDIVLLAYLMDMTDSGIAQLLQLGPTVQYQRTSSLEQLRKIMEEFENE